MGNPSTYFFSALLNTLQYQEEKRERERLKGEVGWGDPVKRVGENKIW